MTTRSRLNAPLLLATFGAGLLLLVAFGPGCFAQDFSKQGTFSVTYTAAGTLTKTIDIGDGTKVVANDARLLATNDAGQEYFTTRRRTAWP